eukprot:TRINITY_DN10833_c0_g1_i15.p1 TRINITY_DN10833_c0_g1~~TRINITY_DN10833_c0_g1_i15.p1  ORF type:complete len:627 (-),score=140.87 TRINITY_DN10833_c0_g1_i15:768-2648(-)
MPLTPRSSQKKLPTKKTLESKTPPKRENATATSTESQNPPNSNLPAATRLESNQNVGKTVLPRIVTIPSSLRSSKVKSKSSEEKEETLLRIGRKHDKGEGKSYKREEEEIAEEEDGVLERANNRRKQRDYEVFVGGLDRDAVEEDVEEAFKGVGDVVEVRLVKKAYSQRNKGFAFVRFATVEQARRAVTEIKSIKVKGRVCGVLRNNNNETLHLRNICTSWTKDKLIQKLKAFELENLEEVHLMDDPNNKGKNRGYAFLDFSTHMDAVAACTKLQKRDIFFGTNVRAEVAFSLSAVEPDEEVMAQVKSVFLDGLPASWDETDVYEHFKKYGEIENVQLARNMPTAKRKDFGFIGFRTREAAMACIDDVNEKGIGEGTHKVILKATLKKPLLKRAPVMGGRGGYDGKGYGERGPRSHGIGHSYSSRTSATHELLGRDHFDRFGGLSKYSSRGDKLRIESPPGERYADRLRRRELIRREPAPVVERSRRDPYLESSSSARHALDDYQEISTSYSRVPSRRQYDTDSYDPQYEYYEYSPVATYDYLAYSSLKRPYSAIDDDVVVSSSPTRRARMRSSLEMDAYPSHISDYDEYSQVLVDDYDDYERTGYSSRHYESRYLSGSGASRSYY